ncbi:MAG: MFS transporter [Gemmatimonadales bacterium]|nr:MFS transporter [Gemmatimonadales bacterium]
MRKSLWVLMAAAFVDMLGFAMVFPQLPYYATRLGAQLWLIGPLVASFSVAQLASSPLWGRFSDRFGRRPVLLIGLSASAIAFVVFGFATSVWMLFLSRLVQGAGGGTTGVIQAYVSEVTDPSQRARGLGWISAATSTGVSIGGAIGSLAFTLWGPAGPGILAASLCVLNVAFAWRYLPESRPDHAHQAPKRSIRAAVWHVISHPAAPAPRLIWIYAVGMGAFTAMTAVVALYLKYRFGINERTIGPVFLYIGALSVIMRALVLGWLVDRIGETRVMRLGALLLVAGLALYPLPATLWTAAIVFALVPVGTALLFPSVTALASHRADPKELGQTMGVQQSFGGMARVIAPLWATAAFQFLGPASPFFIAAGIMAVVSLLAYQVPHAATRAEPAPAD